MSAVQPRQGRPVGPDGGNTTRRVIATVLFPWMTAKFLFKPRVGLSREDRMLDRLAFWRSVVGLGVILVATSRYQDGLGNIIRKAMETGRLAVVLLPLAILAIVIVTRSGHRCQLLAGMLVLIRRALLAMVFFYLPIVLFLAAAGELNIH